MAYDPDWDDERFPSLEEIYRSDNIIEFDKSQTRQVIKPLIEFIDFVLKNETFKQYVFDMNVLGDLPQKNFLKILSLMRVCAIELIERMLNIVLEGRVDETSIWNIASASLSLSIKLSGAHDWIYSGDILNLLSYLAQKYRSVDPRASVDPKIVNIMERDIMQRTNWKGCSTFYLNRKYDSMFPDINKELTATDYQSMSKKGSSMLKQAVENVELLRSRNKQTGKYEFVLKHGFRTYNVDESDRLPFRDMNVVVEEDFVNIVASEKNLTQEEAFNWLRDRVMKVGFEINPLSFEYKQKTLFGMRAKARKVSRKSRKSVRKSRKVSRKSRKSVRKSRKVSRKSRKVSRKSRKVSSRKSRKSVRKSRKVSRKSRKVSRKSRKSVRKSRKVSRKSRKSVRKSRKV
jgi:hypothetical protein